MSEKKRIPEIRFNGFEGEWEEKILGNVAEITMGHSPKGENYTNNPKDNILIQGNQDIANSRIFPRIWTKQVTKLAKKGDLIFTVRAPVGDVAITDYDAVIGRGVCSINADKFIYYNLQKKKYFGYWNKFVEGSTFESINSNILKNSILNIPEIKERKSIGYIFEKIDFCIDSMENKVLNLKNYKKSMLQKMFPKEGERVPEIRFEGFEGEWKEKLIKNIFKVTRGNVLSTKNISACKSNRFIYPVYSSQTQNNGLLGYYNEFLFENAITWTTDGANAGTVKFRKGKFYSTNVNGVLLSEEGYANYCISEILNREAYKHVSYVGNPKLMNNVMEKIKIKIPNSIDEQEKISEIIEKIDKKITLQQEKLDTYKNLKKTLLDKMFV